MGDAEVTTLTDSFGYQKAIKEGLEAIAAPKLLYLVIDRKPDDPTKRAVFLSTHWDAREAIKASWQAGFQAGDPARFTVSSVGLPK